MNAGAYTSLSSILATLTMAMGLFAPCVRAGEVQAAPDYSNQLVLSELKQQSDVLSALMQQQEAKALELLITRIQSDLLFFQTASMKRDPELNKPKVCEALRGVAPTVRSYSQRNSEQGHYALEHLEQLLTWCAG